MPKLILRSNYMRDAAPSHLQNYVQYLGTRKGAVRWDGEKGKLPATEAQKAFIERMEKDFPEAKTMHEAGDYRLNPTRENASDYITQALEQNLDLAAKRENYVSYLANRPRAVKDGAHALFSDAGRAVELAQVKKEVTLHKGPIWTHVVSIRREDAIRLGYESLSAWQSLVRSKTAVLSKELGIPIERLRWYASFHNESHHPHVHIMVFSSRDNEGYLTKIGIQNLRSAFAHAIFAGDFQAVYEVQNQAREQTKSQAGETLRGLVEEYKQGELDAPLLKELRFLAQRLPGLKGKKQYGYLPPRYRNAVDLVVDRLERDSRVAELYGLWLKQREELHAFYHSKLPPRPFSPGQPPVPKHQESNHPRGPPARRTTLTWPGGTGILQTERRAGGPSGISNRRTRITPGRVGQRLARSIFRGRRMGRRHGLAGTVFQSFSRSQKQGSGWSLSRVEPRAAGGAERAVRR